MQIDPETRRGWTAIAVMIAWTIGCVLVFGAPMGPRATTITLAGVMLAPALVWRVLR